LRRGNIWSDNSPSPLSLYSSDIRYLNFIPADFIPRKRKAERDRLNRWLLATDAVSSAFTEASAADDSADKFAAAVPAFVEGVKALSPAAFIGDAVADAAAAKAGWLTEAAAKAVWLTKGAAPSKARQWQA
jgi:hypothetical protein